MIIRPNQTRRSIARHVRNYRFELAALGAISFAAACATGPSPAEVETTAKSSAAVITTAQGITAAQKAINFMVPDAVTFTQQNHCLSCHRQPDTLISASIAAQLLPGINLDTSAATGTGFIANLVTGNQQADGHWDDSGSITSMSAESLWALAGYARAGGAINVLPNVRKGLLWLVPHAATITFPADSASFAGGQRTYLGNDFTDSPQMFDWYLPTAQSVFATRVLLDLDTTLGASDVSTLAAQQASYTDALEGDTMRALTTTTVQHLALTAIAMSESGRAATNDGQAIGAQLIARQTSGAGWADPLSPDGTLGAVNTLTTGQALYALCRLGIRPRANAKVGAGLDWLTGQQQSDGSWQLPSHNSAVSSSWALLAVACVSNPSGTAEFNPLTADGSPKAPVSETFTSVLNVTNTSSDARTATITVTGGPTGAIISATPSTLNLAGDASSPVTVSIKLPPGLPASTSYPFTATVSFTGGSSPASQIAGTFTTAVGSTPDSSLTKTTIALASLSPRASVGSNIPLSATVSASDGQTVHTGSVAFSIDGTVIATVPAAGNTYATTWTVPSISVGNHTLHVAYLGASGSIVLDPSAADQVIDIQPPAPPSPSFTGVKDGTSSANGQYNLSGVGVPGDTIAILANGVVVRTATVGSDGTWGASFALSPGAYAIGVVETGPGGSSSPTLANVSVEPTAPIVGGPASGTTFTSMETTVSGMATPGATIIVTRGGVVVGTTTAGSDGTYSIGIELAPGPNALSVSQTVNGQTSALSGITYNETPSAPSIASAQAETSAQRDSAITITGTTVPGATVLLLDNGDVIGSATAGSNATYAIPARLTSGKNKLSVTSSVGGIASAPSRVVMVRVDAEPPFFPAPPVSLLAYAPTNAGTTVTWPALTAYDAQDGTLASHCDHPSSAIFPVGSTKVTCAAADALGNESSAAFDVKVVLQVLPTLDLPSGKEIVVKTAIATGANVSFDVTAKDAEGNPLAAFCSPASGTFFAAGTTKVTCTASDDTAKTAASGTFSVTVVPVPYYDVDAGANASPPVSASGGGCSMSTGQHATDFSALAAVGLAIAAARRRRKANGID